ncbi:MAG TPA: hypothetical protein VJQ25_05740, partial [Nitrospira sp.]|nr:hypothetical protein [Nitrospira sp.]
AAAFLVAAGSGFARGAEDFDSVPDADSFYFTIHPLMKQTFTVGTIKLSQKQWEPEKVLGVACRYVHI